MSDTIYDVFISYSSLDQKVAEGVCGYLESRKIRCFVAYRDIPRGKVWASAITDAIDSSRMMIAVFSKNFNSSEQTDRELELASDNKMPILTYRIANDTMTGAKKYYLKNLNWIDAFPNPDEKFSSLYQDVCKLLDIDVIDEGKNQPSQRWEEQRKREEEARARFRAFTVGGVPFRMVRVEGGTFQMGVTAEQGSEADDDEKPVHSVTLGDYYIGETEVTQALWRAVRGSNPSYFKGDDRPVETVSWNECQTFIKKLNQLTGETFRLPTEAEWEYAARGGKKSKGYKYSGSDNIDEVAWYDGNSGGETHPVGQKRANELGLYDMSGNVFEWCHDRYDGYSSGAQDNPQGPKNGSSRVSRGGSWGHAAKHCRVSFRNSYAPSFRDDFLGFRLVVLP